MAFILYSIAVIAITTLIYYVNNNIEHTFNIEKSTCKSTAINKETIIEGWIAKDELDEDFVRLHVNGPHLSNIELATDNFVLGYISDGPVYLLDKALFPNITFDNSPQKYKLILLPE